MNNNGYKIPENNNTTQNIVAGTVNIQNLAFSPKTITIKKGDIVTWQNNDNTIHNVISDDERFNLGEMTVGSSVKYTFDLAGTFNYHCSIHPYMTGTVIVQ